MHEPCGTQKICSNGNFLKVRSSYPVGAMLQQMFYISFIAVKSSGSQPFR